MPPLVLHVSIAQKSADSLREDLLDGERGSMYLGATAPDIRVITRWERERTHFFDLDNFDDQDGVAAFLEAHSSLADAGAVSSQTRAFVAGYLTHLIMDERWISTVYRPYFGERSPLGGNLRANIMDRALQFSVDCDRRRDSEFIAHVVDAVSRCDLAIDIGFIDSDTMRHWQQVVTDMISRAPDWARFRLGARRHIGVADNDAGGFEELMRSMPDLVDETLRYLTPERLDSYMEEVERESLTAIKEYLKCGL